MDTSPNLPSELARRRRRADAAQNAERILRAATRLLRADTDASIEEVAEAAGLSRATVYRHFRTRDDLVKLVREQSGAIVDANVHDALRPPGELAGGPTPLDVSGVLNKVPPHLLGEQIVAEAQRLAGESSVALYLVDIDGTLLLRLAGSEEFPHELPVPLAVGPEIPREGLPALRALVAADLPGSIVAPLLLRGRAIGVLLAVNAPEAPLLDLARHAAAALDLANRYSDVFAATRRRKETSAAAEVQQNLLPPRIVRIAGGVLAGNVLPGYEIGGDWFDYTENSDGAWIGIADCKGAGTTAAALGAVSLGAFRAKRRAGGSLSEIALAIDGTMREVEVADAFVNLILAQWHGPSSVFRWINCAHNAPLLISAEGEIHELDGPSQPALGVGEKPDVAIRQRRLVPGERLLLLSDGVLERRARHGRPFGMAGVRAAVARSGVGAAATVRAIEDAIASASADPLEDDATIVVLAASAPLEGALD
jgi:serine phosphatase RsbU (regulator of sigma subunit)